MIRALILGEDVRKFQAASSTSTNWSFSLLKCLPPFGQVVISICCETKRTRLHRFTFLLFYISPIEQRCWCANSSYAESFGPVCSFHRATSVRTGPTGVAAQIA